MRKKLDTRFPASRIKKIMQADEDIGKIAMAVPVLVSKALELFLQDLCDRTYEITLQRGAKTMSALHLKQCVQTFTVFDFLRDILTKVPDLGGVDAGGDERHTPWRRKVVEDDLNGSDEDSKRTKTQDGSHGGCRGRGRGRGRGRRRGGSRSSERENAHLGKCEDEVDLSPENVSKHNPFSRKLQSRVEDKESKEDASCSTSSPVLRKFDLNLDLDEHGNNPAASTSASASTSVSAIKPELNHEEYPGWELSEMNKIGIDPLQFLQLNGHAGEAEEDYDNEEG